MTRRKTVTGLLLCLIMALCMLNAAGAESGQTQEAFYAYMGKDRLNGLVPVKTVAYADLGGGLGRGKLQKFVQDQTTAKFVTVGWTDLCNPGKGYDSSEYTESTDLEAGKYYDYTFYMMPTAYTVAPGHHLYLILTVWDPLHGFLDESFNLDLEKKSEELNYQYSFRIDNTSLNAMLPVAPSGSADWQEAEPWKSLEREGIQ